MQRMLIIDAHCDTLWAAPRQGRDWSRLSTEGHADLIRMLQANIGIQVLALFSDPAHRETGYLRPALNMVEQLYHGLQNAQDGEKSPWLGVVLSRDDVERARSGFGIVLSIEGGEVLGGSLDTLEQFFHLGVRSLGLVWNHRNELADGVGLGEEARGLTPFGRDAVDAMERFGMVVDVSHLADPGFWDVMEICRRPVIASHSNVRALCPHPRNLSDAQIKALAQGGGVVGINFHSPFLRREGRADLDDVIAHVDYVASLVGPDYVGIGSDFDGIPSAPLGLEDVTCIPRLAHELSSRGYSERAVRAIMGENFARVFRTVLP